MDTTGSRSDAAATGLIAGRQQPGSPTNLGSDVNSTANDLRASLSWNATTLYFGSNRAAARATKTSTSPRGRS